MQRTRNDATDGQQQSAIHLRVLPAEHRLTGQLGMLLLMVAITYTGLFLLLTS